MGGQIYITKNMKKNQKIIGISLFAVFLIIFSPFSSWAFIFSSSQNKVINPGFEKSGVNRHSAYGWHSFHSGYARSSVHHTGRHSIRVRTHGFSDIGGAYQRIDLNQTEIKPVYIEGYVRGCRIRNSTDGYFGASIYAEIHLQDGSIVYWNSLPNYGSFYWRKIGFNTRSLTLDGIHKLINKPISHIFIVPILGKAVGTAYFDDITVKEFTPYQSAITLMFDDGEENTLTVAKPILDNYGFKATASIIVNEVGEDGFMKWNDIRYLENSGWEIASHSLSHRNLTLLSPWEIKKELYLSKKILTRQKLHVNNFVLPYGAYNDYILDKASSYYSSVRSYEQGDNPQGLFPFEIKVRGTTSSTTPEQVSFWIKEAQNNKHWVILVFHSIAQNGDDEYYMTPETFKEVVRKIKESRIPVVTYNEGLKLFQAN